MAQGCVGHSCGSPCGGGHGAASIPSGPASAGGPQGQGDSASAMAGGQGCPCGAHGLWNPAQALPEAGSWPSACALSTRNHQCLPGFGDHRGLSLSEGEVVLWPRGSACPAGLCWDEVQRASRGHPPVGVNARDRLLATARQPLLTPTQKAVPGGAWRPAAQGGDKVHRLHHMPREPGPKSSAGLAGPHPAPQRACCAHPPEPP